MTIAIYAGDDTLLVSLPCPNTDTDLARQLIRAHAGTYAWIVSAFTGTRVTLKGRQ